MILIPFAALLVGVFIALALQVPALGGFSGYYLAIACLAGFDTVLGGIRAGLEDRFESGIFLSGFFVNIAIAFLLAFIGDNIGVNLYLVVAFVFGNRIFNNLSLIRRMVVTKMHDSMKRRQRQAAAMAASEPQP